MFCATQEHALAARERGNQIKTSKDPNYCVRVTANDGDLSEQLGEIHHMINAEDSDQFDAGLYRLCSGRRAIEID